MRNDCCGTGRPDVQPGAAPIAPAMASADAACWPLPSRTSASDSRVRVQAPSAGPSGTPVSATASSAASTSSPSSHAGQSESPSPPAKADRSWAPVSRQPLCTALTLSGSSRAAPYPPVSDFPSRRLGDWVSRRRTASASAAPSQTTTPSKSCPGARASYRNTAPSPRRARPYRRDRAVCVAMWRTGSARTGSGPRSAQNGPGTPCQVSSSSPGPDGRATAKSWKRRSSPLGWSQDSGTGRLRTPSQTG